MLLDTHLLLWGSNADPRLKPKTVKRILASDTIFFSAASIAEIAIKHALGKLEMNPDEMIASALAAGFIELPVSASHGARIAKLPAIHNDPFDRMLVAQAMVENITLLTSDKLLATYGPSVEIV